MDFTAGTVIAGRYRLDHPLGEGGMGSVWAATHMITGGKVALKFVKAAGEDMRRRFLREARAATLVEHPNVLAVRDVLDHEDTPVIVMDLLHGETLGSLLLRESKLSIANAARIMLPVISAVGAAHEAGLIHRDLKPENVFLARSPRSTEVEVVRVLDFGIAKLVRPDADEAEGSNVTVTGAVIGTPAYMSPEQLFGEKDLDYRVDVWAIGVILYELLVGERPVDGDNFGQLAKRLLSQEMPVISVARPDLPEDVVAIVTRMLSRERDDRLRDLREAAEVLSRHTSQKVPTFGAPRNRPAHDSGVSDPYVTVSAETDPNASTMVSPSSGSGSASRRKTTDPTAKTVEAAPSAPRMDTAAALITPSRERSRSWMPVAMGSLAVALVGIVAIRFMPSSNPAPFAPGSAPVAASPLVAAPIPIATPFPQPVASPSATEPPPVASVVPAASVSATAPVNATVSTAKYVPKLPKTPTTTTAASTVATVPPPPPPPSATATGGSGLVTKPPF